MKMDSGEFPDSEKGLRPGEIDAIDAWLFYPAHIVSGDCWCMPEVYTATDCGAKVWSHRRTDH